MQKNFSSLSQAEENGTNIQVVLERISGLHSDVNELKESTKDSMKEIATALNKLVALEIHQAAGHDAIAKLVAQMEKMDERLQTIERDEGIKKLTSNWTLAAVWTIVGAAAVFVGKLLGVA
jgi:SMC interacting uncharacterized protein involved in chromosome segregation